MKASLMKRSIASLALGAFCLTGTTVFAESAATIPAAPTQPQQTEKIQQMLEQTAPKAVELLEKAGMDTSTDPILLYVEQSAARTLAALLESLPAENAQAQAQVQAQTQAQAQAQSVNTQAAAVKPAAAPAPAVKQAKPVVRKTAPAPKKTAVQTVATPSGNKTYKRVIHAVASGYSAAPEENGGYAGLDLFGNPLKLGTIAVDPSVIPLGSTVYITGYSFSGLPQKGMIAKATDIGGAIKGNRIDIFIPGSRDYVSKFGLQNVSIYVLD